MAFTMEKNKFEKGDIVVYEGSTYVVASTEQNGYVSVYGIALSEMKDDVIKTMAYINQDELKKANEYQINQIGYLMKEVRELILKGETPFAFEI